MKNNETNTLIVYVLFLAMVFASCNTPPPQQAQQSVIHIAPRKAAHLRQLIADIKASPYSSYQLAQEFNIDYMSLSLILDGSRPPLNADEWRRIEGIAGALNANRVQ